jgi:hypothetical protein
MRIQRRSGPAVQYLSSMVCQPQFNLESVTVSVSHGILTSSQEPPDRFLEKLDRASLCRLAGINRTRYSIRHHFADLVGPESTAVHDGAESKACSGHL